MVGTMVQLLYSSVLCCCWYSQNRLSSEFSSVSENSSTHRQSKAAWAWQWIGCVCLCLLRRQKLNLKAEQNGKRAKEDGSSSQMQCMAPTHLVHSISDYYATKGNVINTSKIEKKSRMDFFFRKFRFKESKREVERHATSTNFNSSNSCDMKSLSNFPRVHNNLRYGVPTTGTPIL